MLGCLKSCIRHPKEKRNKARPGYPDTVGHKALSLSHGNASTSSLNCGGNVALECGAPIVEAESVSRIEEDVDEETEDELEEETASTLTDQPRIVMGMTEESAVHAELASATIPKERKFQVVRVPGVFSRGRWKCWDYRDDVKPVEGLTFTDDKENDAAVSVTASTSVSTTVSDPAANHSPLREESSTIVVTSIAPAPPTPQHGTPSSISELSTPPYTITEVHHHHHHHASTGDWSTTTTTSSVPPSSTVTISQPASTATLTPPGGDTVVVQSVASPSPQQQVLLQGPTPITPTPSMTSVSTFDGVVAVVPALGASESTPVASSTMAVATAVVEEMRDGETTASTGDSASPPSMAMSTSTTTPSPEMTRSGSEAAAAAAEDEPASAAPAMSNAAAIDNKIEQAMDLVKTHLTFAVREEVEILRTTIAELESKVTTLETQNAYLKRHVTPEVLASLPGMVLQHKMSLPATAAPLQLQQQSTTSAPSSTISPSFAAVVQHEALQSAVEAAAAAAAAAKPYCPVTTSFVASLNTVVNPPPSTPR
ncbi:hypothetical protein PENTCL1PPCAC_25040 [Pristionchus entomophagus]|uniref:Uncharacterized protein n=1 Tax=Pristionchus entomophagus TaxID=358040 RepID=A0AAV5U7J8_9BILA|nr:hypothetical protein PENTCL1PPCAC_25040 [Pristionchus entomophagus]